MWKTHGWPACAILVWLIITIQHYPHSLANPLGPFEKFRATDWWKWWKMIKNEKTSRHSAFFFRCSPEFIICLSCFYHFFRFPRKQRNMNKNLKKMIKNDKTTITNYKNMITKIFNWIYNPWLPKNLIYMNNCISWETWPMPESSGASRRIIRTTRVAKLDIGVNLTDRCGKPMVDQRVPS